VSNTEVVRTGVGKEGEERKRGYKPHPIGWNQGVDSQKITVLDCPVETATRSLVGIRGKRK